MLYSIPWLKNPLCYTIYPYSRTPRAMLYTLIKEPPVLYSIPWLRNWYETLHWICPESLNPRNKFMIYFNFKTLQTYPNKYSTKVDRRETIKLRLNYFLSWDKNVLLYCTVQYWWDEIKNSRLDGIRQIFKLRQPIKALNNIWRDALRSKIVCC